LVVVTLVIDVMVGHFGIATRIHTAQGTQQQLHGTGQSIAATTVYAAVGTTRSSVLVDDVVHGHRRGR
jgi:hypothetical protein